MGKSLIIKGADFSKVSINEIIGIPLAYIYSGGHNELNLGTNVNADETFEMKFRVDATGVVRILNNKTTTNDAINAALNTLNIAIKRNASEVTYNNFREKDLVLIDTPSLVKMNNTTISTVIRSKPSTIGSDYLYSQSSDDSAYCRVYYLKIGERVYLKPVLYNDVPCFYDFINDNYLYISGSDSIKYATVRNPETEITYK